MELRKLISDFKLKKTTYHQTINDTEELILTNSLHTKAENIQRSKYGLSQWFTILFNPFNLKTQKVNNNMKLIDTQTNLYVKKSKNNIIIDGASIRRHKLDKYKKLFESLTANNIEEEFLYLEYMFRYLF